MLDMETLGYFLYMDQCEHIQEEDQEKYKEVNNENEDQFGADREHADRFLDEKKYFS